MIHIYRAQIFSQAYVIPSVNGKTVSASGSRGCLPLDLGGGGGVHTPLDIHTRAHPPPDTPPLQPRCTHPTALLFCHVTVRYFRKHSYNFVH